MRNGGTGVWQGFDFEWAKTPHRVHRLASWIDDLEAEDGNISGSCASHFSVGRVPDAGVARTYIGGVRGHQMRFREGSSSVSLGAYNGEAARVDGERVEVQVEGEATAILRGFRLSCTSHESGIHPQGFGVRLCEIENGEEGCLSFTPSFYVHAANSPDIVTGWKGEYHFEFEAMYSVLYGPSDEVAFRVPCNNSVCAEVGHKRKQRPEAPARINGHPERFNHGALAMRGFCWEQQHRSWGNRNGRFMRRFEAHLGDQDYNSRSGTVDFKPRMNFSNDGLIPYPVRAQHQMWTTLIQYNDGRPGLEQHEAKHGIPTGIGEGAVGFSRFELG